MNKSKRKSYYLARALVCLTGSPFICLTVLFLLDGFNPDRFWVYYVISSLFTLSIAYSMYLVVYNASIGRRELSDD